MFRDGLDLSWEWFDAAGSDAVSQKIQLGLPKLSFLRVGCQTCSLQALQDQHQVSPVLRLPLAKDKDVVQVGEGALDARQDLVHQPLEGVSCVPHAKDHPREPKQAKWDGAHVRDGVRGGDGVEAVVVTRTRPLSHHVQGGCPRARGASH